MIKKIFFFVSSPLDKRDVDRFGFEILQRNGFDVEVWDFTEILNPERFKYYTPPDKSNFDKCRFFSRKEEARVEIRKLPKNSFVIFIISYNFGSYFILRALSKYNIPYGLYSYNYPVFNLKKKSIIRRILKITPSKLFTNLFYAAPLK
jgi:hypothetical protein